MEEVEEEDQSEHEKESASESEESEPEQETSAKVINQGLDPTAPTISSNPQVSNLSLGFESKKRDSKFSVTHVDKMAELDKIGKEITIINKELEDVQSRKRAKKEDYRECLAQIAAVIEEQDENLSDYSV